MTRRMSRRDTQPKDFLFHNLTSYEPSSRSTDLRWVTEVVQSAPSKLLEASDIQTSKDLEHDGSCEIKTKRSIQSKTGGALLSFVNVSGPPTKDGRKEARKRTTATRKEEKKQRILEDERKAVFLALTTGSLPRGLAKPNTPTQTVSQDFSVFSLAHISRFAASRLDPFMIYPFELTHREKRLLDHIFYVECEAIKPYKESTFPLGLTDVAAFHQALANIAIQLDSHRVLGQGAEHAVQYEKFEVETRHNAAIQAIRKRLVDPKEATSDGTIATIITMICYSHLTRDFTAWHSHIRGLTEILKLQNQLRKSDEVTSSEPGFLGFGEILRQSIAWVDVSGCGTQDLKPYFPFIPRKSLPNTTKPQPQSKAILIVQELVLAFPLGAEIFNLFSETAVFVEELKSQLSNQSKRVYEDSVWRWDHLYPLIHKLYSYREVLDVNDEGSVVQECCRLALCIFLTHIRAKFGIAVEVLGIYVDQLLPLVQNQLFKSDYGSQQTSFRLWVLVLGAMESSGEARTVFVDILKTELRVLGIQTHVDFEEALMGIIWIGEIDGERFWKLYGELWIVGESPTLAIR